jgi:hypothetical protein
MSDKKYTAEFIAQAKECERDIGTIGNYYGDLSVKEESGRYFWSIENYDGHHWEEIPEYLYHSLVKYEDERGKAND